MSGESRQDPVAAAPLLRKRDLCGLALVVLALAGLACCAARSPWPGHPFLSLLEPSVLPAALASVTLAGLFLLAPLWAESPDAVGGERGALARAAFISGWAAAALGFFLLIAARLTPLDGLDLLRCLVLVWLTGALAILLAARLPRAYAGVSLVWCVVLPVGCYLTAEVFRTTPAGSTGWLATPGTEASRLHAAVHWLLALSPGTAATGALDGRLADRAAYGWGEWAALAGGTLAGAIGLLSVMGHRIGNGRGSGFGVRGPASAQ